MNERFESSVPGVWAAGDCCWVNYKDVPDSGASAHATVTADACVGTFTNVGARHWMQMQLWSQVALYSV